MRILLAFILTSSAFGQLPTGWTQYNFSGAISACHDVGYQRALPDSVSGRVSVFLNCSPIPAIYASGLFSVKSSNQNIVLMGDSGSGTGTQTSSGTAVTRTAGVSFLQSFVGTGIGLAGSPFTIASVADANHLATTAGTPSSGTFSVNCPNNSATWFGDRHPGSAASIDTTRHRLYQAGGDCTPEGGSPVPRTDTWYLSLTSNPAADPFTVVTTTHSIPGHQRAMDYDADDDVHIWYGDDSGAESEMMWVFCSADSPGNGTLTAKQLAVGCLLNNDWTNITASTTGTGGVVCSVDYTKCGQGKRSAAFVYNPVSKKFVNYGGVTVAGADNTETWEYAPITKVWTKLSPVTHPPINTVGNKWCALAVNLVTGLIYYYDITLQHLWTFDYTGPTWTDLGPSAGPTDTETLAYDPVGNALVIAGHDGTATFWIGQFPTAGSKFLISQ